MTRINNFFLNLTAATKREEGQGTVEYILVTGLIAVALVAAAVGGLDDALDSAIAKVASAITAA